MAKILTFCADPLCMGLFKALSQLGIYVKVEDLNGFFPETLHQPANRAVNFGKDNGNSSKFGYISGAVDSFKPDMVLSTDRDSGKEYYSELVKLCKEKGIFHCYWAVDDSAARSYARIYKAMECDYIFSPAVETIYWCESMEKPCSVLQSAYSTEIRSKNTEGSKYDIALAADCITEDSTYEEQSLKRACYRQLVKPLIDTKHDIHIWGRGWEALVPQQYLKGEIAYNQVSEVYNQAKIVIAFEWDSISGTRISNAPFEAMACKAAVLSQKIRALEKVFEDKVHLLLSDSPEKTVWLADFYLKNGPMRETIAANGYAYACKEHNYDCRAKEMMEALKPYVNLL